MNTVYAKSPYTYAFSWKDYSVKVAKIPAGQALIIVREIEGAYEVKPLEPGKYEPYPTTAEQWYVRMTDVTTAGTPVPVPPTPPALGDATIPDIPVTYDEPTVNDWIGFAVVVRWVLGR